MKNYLAIFLVLLWGCGLDDAPPPPGVDPPPTPVVCSASIGWESSFLREGGFPLLPEEIEKFTIYVAIAPGQLQEDLLLVADITDGNETMHRIDVVPVNSYIYMTVTDKDGATSGFSGEWFWDCVVGVLVVN